MPKDRHHNIPASYLVLMKGNQVLLLRRFNTGYEDGNYSMVSGHVDGGETFTACIIREAGEEAGIVLVPENVHVAHVMHRKVTDEELERVDVFFVAEKWSGEITNKEPHKCDDLSWFDVHDLPGNVISYVRQAIECITQNIHYSEYGWE